LACPAAVRQLTPLTLTDLVEPKGFIGSSTFVQTLEVCETVCVKARIAWGCWCSMVCPYLRLIAKFEERRPVWTGLPVAAGKNGRA